MMRWFWPLSHLGSWWLDLSTWQYMIKLINLAVDEGMILHHWSTWRLMRGMKQWWWRGPLVVKDNGHVKWPFVLEWWWRLTASHMWRETSFHVMMVRDSFLLVSELTIEYAGVFKKARVVRTTFYPKEAYLFWWTPLHQPLTFRITWQSCSKGDLLSHLGVLSLASSWPSGE